MSDSQQSNLDDASDLFQFGGDTWGVDHTKDPWTPQYHEATFHTTTVHLAWSRICWEGQDISIYGAKRDNHGLYAVSIDNQEPVFADGFSKKEQIQAVLYSSGGLEWGKHQLTIWNTNKFNFTKNPIWLDVDFASFTGSAISCNELPEISITPSDPSGVNATSTGSAFPTKSTGAVNATATLPQVNTSSIAAFSVTTAPSVSPTTTILLGSSVTESVSTSMSSSGNETQASAAATGPSSSAIRLVAGIEGQLALLALASWWLARVFQ
ncbi:uncharacterized protein I303_107090 [Kwoniella dejecticola CBS 10117]|uniref:Uncharacterized protein n=1 Tax=Kwoniella dejecticola CBS 10117 TaxID=1296121 RepID=A0A1A5ZYP7_9TREE|nr:uncharacterized protein I303_06491 [Kwoniella dejecticola CBS 10117]OBR82933.1 hypothetical protein I303_06491 [Kwoniella dejecticola CBS 10117]